MKDHFDKTIEEIRADEEHRMELLREESRYRNAKEYDDYLREGLRWTRWYRWWRFLCTGKLTEEFIPDPMNSTIRRRKWHE